MESSRRRFLKTGAGGVLGVSAAVAAQGGEAPADVLPFFEVVARRRSVRRYKTTPVPDAHLRLILDAGRLAPDSSNRQPWRFLVVKDRTRIERIRKEALASPDAEMGAHPSAYLDGVLAAPVHILVFVDTQAGGPTYRLQDGSLAAGQMMLAARALGYGTVFITSGIPEDATRKALGIPQRYQRICMMPVGIPDAATPDGWPPSPRKKLLEQLVANETLTE